MADDYAIVIGLSRYPKLGDPPPADLRGPGSDAEAVVKWLTGPGGLQLDHVKLVHSSETEPAPTRDEIHEATFLWLDGLAEKNQQAGQRRVVGRRLYVYVSGHGFSPRFNQGCLLAGNAAERQYSANVFPSAWIDWLQDAGYFREFVLWMDCCMDRQVLTQPTPPPLDPLNVGTPPGPTFIAFAASRPLKAVEKPIPEDAPNWHGIFTWNLLQGLKGAARNSLGNVTGRSLADWLRQAQLGWLDDADRLSPDISKEPAILDEDDELIFVRGVPPLKFDVTLRFPASMPPGVPGRLWSGAPATAGITFTTDSNGVKLQLEPGLYLAEVMAGGLRHGFTVTRSGDIALSEQGLGPVQTAGSFALTVDPSDATAEIRVVGGDFRILESGTGRLTAHLPTGLYQFRIRIGRQVVEKVILLDSDWPRPEATPAQALPVLPTITSAAPLPDTRATHEYQQAAARDAVQRIDVPAGNGAQLMVMARAYSPEAIAGAGTHPWDGVKILDAAGHLVADMTTTGEHRANAGEDPVGVCSLALDPGAYVLRYAPAQTGPEVAQSLVLPPGGWRMEAYLLRYLGSTVMSDAKPRISLLMHRINAPWASGEDVVLEKARVALADEIPILNDELAEILFGKSENPLAGIIGGHLMLLGREQDATRSIDALNQVVTNLRVLVGPDHPDVEALSLACPDPALRRKTPVTMAPIYERSWRLLVKESQTNREIVPLSLWRQVHAAIVAPPFLIWSADDAVQKEFREALAKAVLGASAVAAAAAAASLATAAAAAIPTIAAPASILATFGKAAALARSTSLFGLTLPGGAERASRETTSRPSRVEAAEAPAPKPAAPVNKAAAYLDLPPDAVTALAEEFTPGP